VVQFFATVTQWDIYEYARLQKSSYRRRESAKNAVLKSVTAAGADEPAKAERKMTLSTL
jgi:hypothetical protein